MRSIHSKMWIQSMGWIFWLVGAAISGHVDDTRRRAGSACGDIRSRNRRLLGVVLLSRGLAVKGNAWMESGAIWRGFRPCFPAWNPLCGVLVADCKPGMHVCHWS